MKVLLHICCAPCAVYPLKTLREAGHDVMGFFYRHNIHPFQECLRREECLKVYADAEGLKVVYQKDYDLEGFLQGVVFREANRCRYCYHERLKAAAVIARRGRFDAFTTTLLYSKHQKHEMVCAMGESLGRKYGVPFLPEDFRKGWKEGVETSRRLGLYRQQYCGCIYSEKERFFPACSSMPSPLSSSC